jgi:hypothetical protein
MVDEALSNTVRYFACRPSQIVGIISPTDTFAFLRLCWYLQLFAWLDGLIRHSNLCPLFYPHVLPSSRDIGQTELRCATQHDRPSGVARVWHRRALNRGTNLACASESAFESFCLRFSHARACDSIPISREPGSKGKLADDGGAKFNIHLLVSA